MSLQFIIGGSGSGKTRTLYENLIRQSMEEPDGRFFALVPEQFTMQTQKEIVMLHPNHGVMNIDIVSFERLAYRVFEELAIENLAVLDDMGKSMVLRRVSSGVRGNLHLFGGHLDKAGFISEIKSMLSEFFQYGITEEKLETLIGETKSPLLRQKPETLSSLFPSRVPALLSCRTGTREPCSMHMNFQTSFLYYPTLLLTRSPDTLFHS